MMARPRFLPVFTLLVVVIPLSETNNFPDGSEVREIDDIVPDLAELRLVDCEKRWTCQDYDYPGLSTSGLSHYLDKNCACDDLCLLLQDCCPDAPHLHLPSLSGLGSAMEGRGPSQKAVSYDHAMEDHIHEAGGSFGKESSGRETNGWKPGLQMWSPLEKTDNQSDSVAGRQADHVYSQYSLDKDMFTCIYDEGINGANNVSVVTRCPDHYDDEEVTQLCHNVTDDDMMTRLPVSGKESRVLYRNMFCAMCHEEPYLYWVVGMECKSDQALPYDINSTSLSDVLGKQMCQVQYQPPGEDYRWRPCVAGVRDRCNDSFPMDTARGRHIVESCEEPGDSIQRMVFGYTSIYRNQFCALCDHNVYPSIFCQPLSWEAVSFKPTGVERQFPYSFSLLLDINTNRGSATVGHSLEYETVERNETVSCEQGQVFDPFRFTCRPVTCGPGRHFVNNACQIKEQNFESSTVMSNTSDSFNTSGMNDTLHSDCAYIQLNDTEYRLFQNGTLELVGTDTFYNPSQYVYLDQELYLCVSYTQNYTRNVTTVVKKLTFIFSLPETVVSTCGICISLVALAVTMLVYLSVRALRNIPGQNLLSLVCSLFLADLLLLLAPSAEGDFRACAVVAAVIHYCFLAAFLWMNVTAVDVWFTFSKAFVKAGDRGKSSKRFLMYSAYSWLTPLVFVLPAAVLQVVNPGSPVSPGYGEGICWLTNKYALLLFFATPLFLLLLLNTVLFVLSARNICRAQRTTARMLGKEEEGKMGIYVRLTVVMGLTWILGFLAAWIPDSEVLPYCFIIMTTLQGLFIFLSFVCTRKVIALLKDKFCGKQKFQVPKSPSTALTNLSTSLSAKRKLSSTSSKSHSVVV